MFWSCSKQSFLSQLDNTPEAEQFPLVRNWLFSQPLELFAELREKRPILLTPECTLVACFEDVMEVLRLPEIYTVALYKPKMGSYWMTMDRNPIHTREKSIMTAMLNRDDVPGYRQFIGEQGAQILQESAGSIDLVQQYCRLIPVRLVQEKFGLDGIEPEKLLEWSYWNQYDAFHNQPFDAVDDPERVHQKAQAAGAALAAYIGELIPRRFAEMKAGQLRDDIVSRMLRTAFPESIDFPMDRLARNIGGLLIGTVETTAQAVAQVVQQLLQREALRPEIRQAAMADDPQLFDGYVWEALRFHPISPYMFRQCEGGHVLARGTRRECTIPDGENVLLLSQSAMFDPRAFADPGQFDPRRSQENALHFGFGRHACLGRYIGEAMIPEMARQVMRCPNVHAEGPIDFAGTAFPSRYHLRWDS